MPTRTTYRQAGARALGPFFSGSATSGSTTALLECAASPFKTTISADERFENYCLYRPSAVLAADKTRTVKTYDAAAGQFTADNPWTNNPYALGVGEAFELLGVLDADTLHRLVNETLKLTDVLVDVTFTTASSQATQHAMSQAWLTDPDDVLQVGYLASGETFPNVNPYRRVVRGEAIKTNGTVYLTGFSLPTDVTVYAKVKRPAYTYCKANTGSYGDLTAGLTSETDEAVPEEDWVAAGVKMLAWDEFRSQFWPGNLALAEREVARAADRFWSLANEYCDAPIKTFQPLRPWGPRGRARVVGYPAP
jgi:hypothetical protein